MTGALVGIAIPAFAARETLGATLESCVAQTYRDWIAVVTVDGEDTSAEEEIVRSIGDPRIQVVANGRRLGQYWNFNRAMLATVVAGARWIKPLCADDVLVPNAIERMVERGGASPDCGLVYGYFDIINGAGRITARVDMRGTASSNYAPGHFVREALPLFNPVGGPSSVMLSRDAFERCGGFDDRFPWAGDQILWYRIARLFGVGVVGEEPILQYREHGNSVTATMAFSAHRFSDPVALGRDIALSAQPLSVEWLLAQQASGTAMGAGWLTSAALLRRGLVRESLRGLFHSSAPARALWFPFAAAFLAERAALLAGGWRRPARLLPPVIRER